MQELCVASAVDGMKQSSADIFLVYADLFDAKDGKAAIAGNLGRDPLAEEWLKVCFGVFPVIVEVIMGVGVDPSWSNAQAGAVNDSVCRTFYVIANVDDDVIFDEDVPVVWLVAGTVV